MDTSLLLMANELGDFEDDEEESDEADEPVEDEIVDKSNGCWGMGPCGTPFSKDAALLAIKLGIKYEYSERSLSLKLAALFLK